MLLLSPKIDTKANELEKIITIEMPTIQYEQEEPKVEIIEDKRECELIINNEQNKNILVGEFVDEVVYATTTVNIRSGSSVESDIIKELHHRDSVQRIFIGNKGWSIIMLEDDTTGYIDSSYLTTLELNSQEPDKPTASTYIGTFTAYHYCPCASCCGSYTGITATGTVATPGRTIAVDSGIIPLGSVVVINGQTYTAEDTGGGINGYVIDIFVSSHQDALNRGIATVDIYYAE